MVYWISKAASCCLSVPPSLIQTAHRVTLFNTQQLVIDHTQSWALKTKPARQQNKQQKKTKQKKVIFFWCSLFFSFFSPSLPLLSCPCVCVQHFLALSVLSGFVLPSQVPLLRVWEHFWEPWCPFPFSSLLLAWAWEPCWKVDLKKIRMSNGLGDVWTWGDDLKKPCVSFSRGKKYGSVAKKKQFFKRVKKKKKNKK